MATIARKIKTVDMEKVTYKEIVDAYHSLDPDVMPSGVVIHPNDEVPLIKDIIPVDILKSVTRINKVCAFDIYISDRVEEGTFKFVL